MGIKFHDTGSAAGNFAELVGGLRTQVGGFATTEGKSAEGQAAILKNKFSDLQETVGSKLLPVMTSLVGAGIKVLDWLQKTPGAMTAAKVAIVVLGAAVVVATGAWVAMNLAFVATPVGALITGLVLLAGALVVAYKRSQTFRDICASAFAVVKIAALGLALQAVIAFRGLLNVWLSVAAGIVHGAALAFGWIPGLGPKLQAADRKVSGFKDSVNATLGRVQRKLEIQLNTAKAEYAASRLAAKMHQLQSKSITIAVNYRVTAGRIWDGTKFVNVGLRAAGGPIRKGHPYLVGEKGAELIYPTADGMVVNAKDTAAAMAGGTGGALAAGGGTVVNIYVTGPTLGTPQTIAQQVHQALLNLKQTSGVDLKLA